MKAIDVRAHWNTKALTRSWSGSESSLPHRAGELLAEEYRLGVGAK